MIGRPLPQEGEHPYLPELENQIAQAAAQATAAISEQAQAFLPNNKVNQALIPLLQIRNERTELKERELQRKESESSARLAFDVQKKNKVRTGLDEQKN